MGASLPWNPWTHFPTALLELAKVVTSLLTSYWVSDFVGKLNKSSRTPPHYPSSWANSKIFWRMLRCALHHHGPQVAHHDIPSRRHPSSSLLGHKVDFVYTTIIHFANLQMEVKLDSILNVLPHFLGKFVTAIRQSDCFLKFCFSHIHHFKLVFST
jgi:hypothetical protein